MKRFTWLATAVVAMFAFAVPASAQDMPMRLGVIGGANFATLTGDDAGDPDMKTGFDIGALAQFPLGMVLTFQPEVHYSQKGASVEGPTGDDLETSLDYIDIPLLLRAGTALAEGLDVDLLLGPSIGILLNCEDPAGNDCSDETTSTDFGLVVGAGFSWAMGAGDLLLDGRFNMGFSSVDDSDADADINNQNIQVLVGYAFPFGGM